MSLAAFIGGFGSGVESGVNTASAYKYRQSIIKMRQLQTQQMQAAAQDAQNSRDSALTGAMMQDVPTPLDPATAERIARQGGNATTMPGQPLPPGMNYQPGALAWAKQNLPAPQYAQIMQNLPGEGWTPQQISAMETPQGQPAQSNGNWLSRMLGQAPGGSRVPAGAYGPSAGAGAIPDPSSELQQDQYLADMGAQPQATGQAKGGAVPMRRYASGGPIDPDVAAAVSQSNGQPAAPSPAPSPAANQGAIPAPSAPAGGGYMPSGPAVPMQQPQAAPAPAAAPYAPQGAAVPVPNQTNAPAPAGGMQPLHPQGLAPIANPKAPLNVPPAAMASTSPAQAALKHGQVAFGLHPSQAGHAPPQQLAANYTELQHGAGAESNANVQAARAKLFGQDVGNAPLGVQNASLINNLYNYDLENHGPAVAAADSFAVLQNYRINMQMYGGAAVSAFQSGNLQAAAHYIQQAYAFFPDGNNITVAPGANGSLVATRTNPDGKPLDTYTFATPNDLSNFVQATTSFENYNTALDNAQKNAMQWAVDTADINNKNTSSADDNTRTGAYVANSTDEINDRDKTTAGTVAKDQADLNGGKPKPPTASEYASYQTAVQNALIDENGVTPTPLSTTIGFNTAPPAMQNALISLASSLGVNNALDPNTATRLAGYILTNPSAVKNGSVTVRGSTFVLGTPGMQAIAGIQRKATGGPVTPAARAMASLP